MNALDWILLAIVAVCAVIAFRIWRKSVKRGGCCGGGCDGCCEHCSQSCPHHKSKS